jgi:hypothetical protein
MQLSCKDVVWLYNMKTLNIQQLHQHLPAALERRAVTLTERGSLVKARNRIRSSSTAGALCINISCCLRVSAVMLTRCLTASAGAEQDPELINRWGTDTFQHFSRLYASDQGAVAGCVATTGYALHTAGSEASLVSSLFPARELTCTYK